MQVLAEPGGLVAPGGWAEKAGADRFIVVEVVQGCRVLTGRRVHLAPRAARGKTGK